MRWIRTLSARTEEGPQTLGAKAHGLVTLHRLGLPVPAGFVVTVEACREFMRAGRLPGGLDQELTIAMAGLEAATGRRFGGTRTPLTVSVRSGARVSMPGMMNTVLNLGLTPEAATALAAETGDPEFAANARLRFLTSFASAIMPDAPAGSGAAAGRPSLDAVPTTSGSAGGRPSLDRAAELVRRRGGRTVPDDAAGQLGPAIETVFSSWDSPRARTYRDLHGIPHDLGTAVIVQAMVYGNRDDHSGTGVAFSRDPNTGENVPFGDVMFGHQGEDVVSGRSAPRPLHELAGGEPAVWSALAEALNRVEGHYRDACYVEFTFESGELWLLQARPARLAGGAAVRVATDLADERLITRREALLRVSPHHLRHVRTPRIAVSARADILARGLGACPGVAAGQVATTTEAAVRMAADGPVVLVRPETSPYDMRGLAAAAGIVTARGGPASHAAVVARAMGKPAVVGVTGLVVDAASLTADGRTVTEGTPVTIDGTSGEVALGSPAVSTGTADAHLRRLLAWADDVSGDHSERDESDRLSAAHAALRH
ncbi:pyruvate, phosphate dikinase [Nonomuraea longispora]|uniref:Pyruvate, phosphate dikinase n=1 Tax=Nonomuraea longispora TaxID=1848320 RepID=A0A4R4MQX1_9ACTN|nr:pyruvate, phosphate dikinase [Nonomuraea longispora]TDB95751.1 pyruvate, phosphate dikinase [Nonomuraea longispora]